MFYSQLYIVSDLVFGNESSIYTYSELIKALANARYNSRMFIDIHLASNVKHIAEVHDRALAYYDIDADSFIQLTDKQVKKLKSRADTWYAQQKRFDFDGSVDLAKQANLFGTTIEPDEVIYKRHTPYQYRKNHTRHSIRGYKHGRAGRTKSAFARSNYYQKTTIPDLVHNYPFRHRNRKFNRKHLIDFPVWDDAEYSRDRHSTGWKYSTKCKHQWQIHL